MTNEQYYDLIVPYQDALNLLKARLDVLNHSMYGNKSHPIHNIQFRIKQKASIEEKLKRMDLQGSFMNAKSICRTLPESVLSATLKRMSNSLQNS